MYKKKPICKYCKGFGSRAWVKDETVVQGHKTALRSNSHYLIGYHLTGYSTYEKLSKKIYYVCSVKIMLYKDDYATTKNQPPP